MATLRDVFTYLRNLAIRKRERKLTISRPCALVRRLLHRKREKRDPYPHERGPRGGYMVLYLVHDRHRTHVVTIESYPPTEERPYWMPMSPELTLLEVAAISMLRPTRIYALAKKFRSCRKRGAKLVFDCELFMRHDLPELDEFYSPADDAPPRPNEERRTSALATNVRAGRHKPGCPRTESWGPCPVDAPPKKPPMPRSRTARRGTRWTADLRTKASRKSHGEKPVIDWSETDVRPETGYRVCLPEHPTATEARLWRLAGGDSAKYTDLAIEYSDEIEADRAAGRFAPKSPKKR